MKYQSVEDLYDDVEWRGGVVEAIFHEGIRAKDLPNGTPLDIVVAWEQLEKMEGDVRQIQLWLECSASEGFMEDDGR